MVHGGEGITTLTRKIDHRKQSLPKLLLYIKMKARIFASSLPISEKIILGYPLYLKGTSFSNLTVYMYVYVLFSRLTSFPLPSHNKLKSISTLKTLQRAIKLRNFLQKKISEWYKLKFCFLLFKTLKLIRKLHDRKKYLFKKRNYCMLIAILNHTPFLFE